MKQEIPAKSYSGGGTDHKRRRPGGGRIQVSWDKEFAATPFGQLVFFAEFLKVSGLFDTIKPLFGYQEGVESRIFATDYGWFGRLRSSMLDAPHGPSSSAISSRKLPKNHGPHWWPFQPLAGRGKREAMKYF